MEIFRSSIILVLVALIWTCNSTEPEDDLTVKPEVLKSSFNYDEDLFNQNFPKTDILGKIGDAYKETYSNEIKNEMINYSAEQVWSLGEDKVKFLECFELTGCEHEESISLPTYIEKAEFNGESVWIIQLVWGFAPSDLVHYKCFVIGLQNVDTLYYTRCK